MLLIAIPVLLLWLAVSMFVVLLCRAAADADAVALAGATERGGAHELPRASATHRRSAYTWRRPRTHALTDQRRARVER